MNLITRFSLDPQAVLEMTNPKREMVARTVYDKEVITTEISWFLVKCDRSMPNGEPMILILKDWLPRTSVPSEVPSDTSDDGPASETQHAHDEDAETHWDAATELS
jgi:hypothetical protein